MPELHLCAGPTPHPPTTLNLDLSGSTSARAEAFAQYRDFVRELVTVDTIRLYVGTIDRDGDREDFAIAGAWHLDELVVNAFGRACLDRAVVATWDDPYLTVALTSVDGRHTTFELRPLSRDQDGLAHRLAHIGQVNAALAAVEIPDAVARITSRVEPHPDSPDEEWDPDDPLGFLTFADTLTRAGVTDWPPHDLEMLARIADGWTGTGPELLAAASAIGLHD